jgi:hypothetical protein
MLRCIYDPGHVPARQRFVAMHACMYVVCMNVCCMYVCVYVKTACMYVSMRRMGIFLCAPKTTIQRTAYMHTCIHAYTCMQSYLHATITNLPTNTPSHTNSSSCKHTQINTYIHTYIHTYIYI